MSAGCNTFFVTDDDYYAVAKSLLERAAHRIYLAMYQISVKGKALSLVEQIAIAAERVPDVQFILNWRGNQSLQNGVRQFLSQFRGGKNVKVFIMDEGVVHAKVLIVDNWLLLGSSNLSNRGLGVNWEANIVTDSPEALSGALKWFVSLRTECKEIA